MTAPPGGSSGIKLKFSLGSLSSNHAATPAAQTSDKLTDRPITEPNEGLEKSKKGKAKAVNGHNEVATPPTILRLTTGSLSKAPEANGSADLTTAPTDTKPPAKSKKPAKLNTHNDGQLSPVDEPPIAGPSTASAHTSQTTSVAPDTPITPATASTPPTPMTARSRTSDSSITRSGQHVSRNGKVLGRPRGSKTKPSSRQPLRPSEKKAKHVFPRPSAIPPRLLSSTPSTPRPPSQSLPSVVAPATPEPTAVKIEPDLDDDPLAKSLSPVAAEVSTPQEGRTEEVAAQAQTPSADVPKVVKGKKPIKELMQRVMAQLFKKDDYALFSEPVNLEQFPDYLEIIGGEDKMMDFGTMQAKVDSGEYTDFDQLADDLKTLVTAAQTFNPPGTIPYVYAQKILVLGEKQIEKSRPLVATPEPTPDPHPSDSGTPWSAREGTTGLEAAQDLPANLYIPEEMLQFPPNSIYALAVGWNLTGGRRVYSKRQIRGREKFNGKWRHWDLDGTRDWAEAEDPEELLASQVLLTGSRTVVKWKGLRRTGPWWEFEIGGPNGIPPFAFTPFPRPAPKPTYELGTFDWGLWPECEAELALASARQGLPQAEILRSIVRPTKPKPRPGPAPPTNFVNIYDDRAPPAGEWLREMVYGDVMGEAYTRSVKKFVQGAMAGSAASRKTADPDQMPLDEYVVDNWHNGVLRSDTSDVVQQTLQRLGTDRNLLTLAKNSYHRRAMQYLTRPENPLDLAVLLKDPEDFGYTGVGNQDGIAAALRWTQKEIRRLASEGVPDGPVKRKRVKEEGEPAKRVKLDSSKIDSAASSPLSEVPDSPRPSAEGEEDSEELTRDEAMTKLRKELIALCKYYPLSALRKMKKEDATRLLPASVSKLMSRPD